MKFSNKTYDILKWITQIVLPAIGTAYFGLAGYWDLPKADEIVGTIVVIDTFLGVVLGISNVQYNNSDEKFDGKVELTQSGNPKRFVIDAEPEDLANSKSFLLKVDRQDDEADIEEVPLEDNPKSDI